MPLRAATPRRLLLLQLPRAGAWGLRAKATSAAVAFCSAPLPPSPALRLVRPPLLAAAEASSRKVDLPPPGRLRKDAVVRTAAAAAADAAASDEGENGVGQLAADSGSVARTVQLGALFALWYLSNIYFNIYNKRVLKVYPFPLTITAFQFGLGSLIILLMWIGNICKRPKLSSSQLMAILPLAILHALGNLFTNMSLGKVAVSFTHTIKAMEPFFTVVLSAFFLGELPSLWILISLVPVVGGVALASLTEVSFNWIGFWTAMASNLTNQSRNVVSKKLMIKEEESVDNITLFSIITIMSFFLLAPVALIAEGIKFTPTFVQSAGLNLRELYMRSILAALCFHAHQQVTYMVLARVSPVTHSVGNCVKRVVVIISSVLFFNTPVSPINSLGTGLAVAGVFLYSRVKRFKSKST